MAIVYSIRDWNSHFEVAQSKRSERLRWVPLPNKHDGKSYRRLMRMKDGAAIYGAWVLIVQVASKCPVRGTLADADGPLSADDIADKTGAPPELIQSALDACSEPSIGWITKQGNNSEQTRSTLGADSECAQQKLSTEQNRTEQNKTGHEVAAGDGEPEKIKPLRQPPEPSKFDPLLIALPVALDVPGFREAWGRWVAFRKKKRKPISEDAAELQLAELIRYGPDAGILCINESIKNDWQGLFAPKTNGKPKDNFDGIRQFLKNHDDGNGIRKGDGLFRGLPGPSDSAGDG